MDNEPSTSLEADKNAEQALISKKQYKGGGTTCCILTCDSNTKRNPELSFYQIPSDNKLQKMWLHWIGRAKFKQKNHDRVCSKHFIGGKKTCLHNVLLLWKKYYYLHKQNQEQHINAEIGRAPLKKSNQCPKMIKFPSLRKLLKISNKQMKSNRVT